ncbi:adenine deaminase [Synergistaceae bacterium OttesenSCG-928-D05]|nr:adenine deaminase [Synergistaceae bacterium OttesenSCG-928-D05]
MRELLRAARREEPSDLLLKGGRFANVFTMEYETADIAVKDGIIVGIGEGYEAAEVVDCSGGTIVPGFIDGHMHVESTFMTPRNLAATIVPLGTTTIMPDPHEIANTCGMEGIRFMYAESQGLPLDIYYGAPSCVPASNFETPREMLTAKNIRELFDEGICTHLGEMMNYPDVYLGNRDVWSKLEAAKGKIITGHAPQLEGADLIAYILGGPSCDHECESIENALEKLRLGMWLMVRQGATARNLTALAPLIRENEFLTTRAMAVSDDISPDFIRQRGHMNGCIRELIAEGVSPLAALRMTTFSPAEYFQLFDRGAIAPGRIADIVLLDTLESCKAKKVWKRGNLVAENGKLVLPIEGADSRRFPGNKNSVPMPLLQEIEVRPPKNAIKAPRINVIGTIRGQVITKRLEMTPTVKDGLITADPDRDIAKLVVVEKNQGTGRTAVGFVHNYGMKRGAIASSIAHDAHNYTCIGADDTSIKKALDTLYAMGGGIVLTDGDLVLAKLELPVGGLMSTLPFDELCAETAKLAEARKILNPDNAEAFMQLSFLSLSVIPELKLTDQGYCDISAGGAQPLFVED